MVQTDASFFTPVRRRGGAYRTAKRSFGYWRDANSAGGLSTYFLRAGGGFASATIGIKGKFFFAATQE
jgi:hypothetical protein